MIQRCQISGLDVVLEGGIRTVAKLEDARMSTMIVVRGGTGTGKTMFAAHLALDAAAARGGDVVFGLLEMLPTELRAQLEVIRFFPDRDRRVDVVIGRKLVDHSCEPPCVFAGIVGGDDGPGRDIGDDLVMGLQAARDAGLIPRVLVIDTISREYPVGRDASQERVYIDGISKFAAEHGVIVIVLEEIHEGDAPTAWMSAADVVFDLGFEEMTTIGADGWRKRHEVWRTLVVRKSRFNASSPVQHTFTIRTNGGIEIRKWDRT